jgi:hypothetical protein
MKGYNARFCQSLLITSCSLNFGLFEMAYPSFWLIEVQKNVNGFAYPFRYLQYHILVMINVVRNVHSMAMLLLTEIVCSRSEESLLRRVVTGF